MYREFEISKASVKFSAVSCTVQAILPVLVHDSEEFQYLRVDGKSRTRMDLREVRPRTACRRYIK